MNGRDTALAPTTPQLEPKVAETVTAESGGSSTTLWVVVGAAITVALVVVLFALIRRNRGRAVEE